MTAVGILDQDPIDWDMVTANTGLVWRVVHIVARRGPYRTQDPDDLYQDGLFGLVRACQKFEPTKGYALSTYADAWIRQSIQRGTDRRLGRNAVARGRGAVHVSMDAPLFDDGPTLTDLVAARQSDPAETVTDLVMVEGLTDYERDVLLGGKLTEVADRQGVNRNKIKRDRVRLQARLQRQVA